MKSKIGLIIVFSFLSFTWFVTTDDAEVDSDPYTSTDPKFREPSPCEVCKYFVTELKSRLEETGKSKEVFETGHGLDPRKKKKFSYETSELRLTESLMDPHVCDKILKYNVHAEREGSLRYAKGQSETFQTLHGLVDKGVKVDLGIPYELWDQPSAEVTKMHRACFKLAEDHEEDIEDWYYHHQHDVDLLDYLCAKRYLPKFPDGSFRKECLIEDTTETTGKEDEKKEAKDEQKKKKKKKAKKGEKGDRADPVKNKKPKKKKKTSEVEDKHQHTDL